MFPTRGFGALPQSGPVTWFVAEGWCVGNHRCYIVRRCGRDAGNHLVIREADWCTNGRALEEVRYVRVDVIQYCIASCWWVTNLFHMMISFQV